MRSKRSRLRSSSRKATGKGNRKATGNTVARGFNRHGKRPPGSYKGVRRWRR